MKKSGKDNPNIDPRNAAAKKAWNTRREKEIGDLFSMKKQTQIKDRIEKNKRRDAAIAAGPDAYQEYLRQESVSPERVLILVPPKLLDKFRQLCNEESYTFIEGIREAMRRMIGDLQEDRSLEIETPEQQGKDFAKLMKEISRILKEDEDPSILPSQRNTL